MVGTPHAVCRWTSNYSKKGIQETYLRHERSEYSHIEHKTLSSTVRVTISDKTTEAGEFNREPLQLSSDDDCVSFVITFSHVRGSGSTISYRNYCRKEAFLQLS